MIVGRCVGYKDARWQAASCPDSAPAGHLHPCLVDCCYAWWLKGRTAMFGPQAVQSEGRRTRWVRHSRPEYGGPALGGGLEIADQPDGGDRDDGRLRRNWPREQPAPQGKIYR